jgi:hypothetical protein
MMKKYLSLGVLTFSTLLSAQTLVIENKTYPENTIRLDCETTACETLQVSVTNNDGELTFPVERKNILGTLENRRQFSEFDLEGAFEHTESVTDEMRRSFKEGSYLTSGAMVVATPITVSTDLIFLPFKTLAELVRVKRRDSLKEKSIAKKLMQKIEHEEYGEISIKHIKYMKIRDYILSVMPLGKRYAKVNGISESLEEFHYQSTNCQLIGNYYYGYSLYKDKKYIEIPRYVRYLTVLNDFQDILDFTVEKGCLFR